LRKQRLPTGYEHSWGNAGIAASPFVNLPELAGLSGRLFAGPCGFGTGCGMIRSDRAGRVAMRGIFFAVALACCVWGGATTVHAESAAERMEQLIKKSGFPYKKHNASVWSTEFDKKNLGKFRVILSVGDFDTPLVVFVIVAKSAAINKTPAMMEKIAFANYEYDYVKVGLDKDGDLFVRADSNARKIDVEQMKMTINQVANSSDAFFGQVSDFIRR
jgi:hypothetical protein